MEIIIYLPPPINKSLQPGDSILYTTVNPSQVGGFDVNNTGMTEVGMVKKIEELDMSNPPNGEVNVIKITCKDEGNTPPTIGDFMLFSKPREIEEASIEGYYGEFEFQNNSTDKIELFTVGCEIEKSS
tara:strand:+ start:13 stop:396 length:384 start_codon:yes stop_codon:yes gene_type:complete